MCARPNKDKIMRVAWAGSQMFRSDNIMRTNGRYLLKPIHIIRVRDDGALAGQQIVVFE